MATTIQRHSSRQLALSHFLPDVLHQATGYDRIAGYFNSSMLEVAGEAIERMTEGAAARIICNTDLDPHDIRTARAAQQGMLHEWKRSLPPDIAPELQRNLERLYRLLASGRLRVKVLPTAVHGLLHGKAGVIRHADGSRLCFVGSANETLSGWKRNYEIIWADRSAEGCDWVQAEFDALWNHADAHDLAEAVIVDIKRIAARSVVRELSEWKARPVAADAEAIIETPIYTRENGLWAHQKWFIHHAFARHRSQGARLLLADQVGLGKTIQLALAAKLMLLWGEGNVLAVVPKPLMQQWRDELWDFLRLPSAIWTGRHWEDEHGLKHPPQRGGSDGLRECPRRFGIVSAGLVRASPDVRELLTGMNWECVILDEAHHARRKNTGRSKRDEPAADNNLLQFLRAIGGSTKSMLLATATPIQLDPIEAFDLLDALNIGHWRVLGRTEFGEWRRNPREGLAIVAEAAPAPEGLAEAWPWLRDPFPAPLDVDVEGKPGARALRDTIERLTDPAGGKLGKAPRYAEYGADAWKRLRPADRGQLESVAEVYFAELNPYIAHIVRRRREFLETAIDPATNEPFLPKVAVRLFGDRDADAITLPLELREAYAAAEAFCEAVGQREGMNSAFLETLLLRRVGSTIHAGEQTARRMLGAVETDEMEEGDEGEGADLEEEEVRPEEQSKLQPLLPNERQHLERFVRQLQLADGDPKYQRVLEILTGGVDRHGVRETGSWLELGCIIFSQYFESAEWLAKRLTREFPERAIALYAGAGKSGIYRNGMFESKPRDVLKQLVRDGEIRLVVGTDAASEGLNLQRLGALINLDLPWNPTRLEQRKGRIQRIGQSRAEVYVYNMRYRDSVEDRVHQKLSERLKDINDVFGQIPDTLEAVWIDIARRHEADAERRIDELPEKPSFIDKYDRIANVDWESCSVVLDAQTQLDALMRSWDGRRM
ncbi:MAG: DEAD/DEAH box helicase family protein [Thermomicrobiales bacterium]|nr:DEAD/DEAH box helicase family protein [Thermomicrobiales bacterium]